MIDTASIDAVRAMRIDDHLARPLYAGHAFAELPRLVRASLAGAPVEAPRLPDAGRPPRAVITLLLDGFGWSLFERFAELPVLRRVVDEGAVSMVSAQFPTTTASHVTTLHTGAPVGESGVFEWQYYEPTLKKMFMPLRSVTFGAEPPTPVEAAPGAAYPSRTLYATLAEAGTPSYCYQSDRYARSVYSRAVTAGAHVIPFRTLPEAAALLVERVRAVAGRSYHCVYFDVIDAASHRYGPTARSVAAEIRSVFRLVEDEVAPALAGTDSLLLITADHGHVAVDPRRTVYLDELLPELPSWLETTPDGYPMAPAGSARDLFLYVRPEKLERALEVSARALDGLATVHRTRDLIEDGFFGEVRRRLSERLAPVVVLPRPGEMVWWSGDGRFVQQMYGHHGGLSRDELEIPLFAWRL